MIFSKGWKLLVLCFLASAGSAVASDPMANMKVGGFRVPDYNAEGEMVSQFFGEHASVDSASGEVKIEVVRVEFYREGETYLTVESPYCFYNRQTQDAHSDAPVTAVMEGVAVSGTGFKLGVESRAVELLSDSRVVLQDMMGNLNSSAVDEDAVDEDAVDEAVVDAVEPTVTTITSTQLFLNYDDRNARFVDSVHVENAALDLTSNELDIYFDEANQMDRIDALGECQVSLLNAESANPEMELGCETLNIRFADENKLSEIDAFDVSKVTILNAETASPEMELLCETLNLRFAEENLLNEVDALKVSKVTILDSATADPEMELVCETLQIRFAEKNLVDQIDALGGVGLEVFDVMSQTDDAFMAQGERETNDTTVIVSETLLLDQTKRVANFVNEVHVRDGEMELDSETLELHFGESNEINWIEALGKVRLLSEGREAIAGRATYDAKSTEFLLQEEARIIEGRNMLFGDRIRFWRSEKRMVCEPSARVVVFPDEDVKTDIFEY